MATTGSIISSVVMLHSMHFGQSGKTKVVILCEYMNVCINFDSECPSNSGVLTFELFNNFTFICIYTHAYVHVLITHTKRNAFIEIAEIALAKLYCCVLAVCSPHST